MVARPRTSGWGGRSTRTLPAAGRGGAPSRRPRADALQALAAPGAWDPTLLGLHGVEEA